VGCKSGCLTWNANKVEKRAAGAVKVIREMGEAGRESCQSMSEAVRLSTVGDLGGEWEGMPPFGTKRGGGKEGRQSKKTVRTGKVG